MNNSETYISIDVETAGPHPASYSLLSIGACLVADSTRTFYVEVQPVNDNALPHALQVSGLKLEYLAEHGLPPAEAMAQFEAWVLHETPPGHRPVFVAFNAPFDWMFVCDYFYRYLGRNPFGHNALDIKALYMGLSGIRWCETSMAYVAARYLDGHPLAHHALHDAQDQAEIMRKLLAACGDW
jgi:DNA polymerase III epsilon subunit-like protein